MYLSTLRGKPCRSRSHEAPWACPGSSWGSGGGLAAVAVRVAVHSRPSSSVGDLPGTLVQLEPIGTARPRAANAVGTRDPRHRSSNPIGQRRIAVHRGERADPSQTQGTDGPGRLIASAGCQRVPQVQEMQIRSLLCKPICKPDAAGPAETGETQKAGDDLAPYVCRGQYGDLRLPETVETHVVWLITQRSRVQIPPPLLISAGRALSRQGEGLFRDRECDQRKAPVRYAAAGQVRQAATQRDSAEPDRRHRPAISGCLAQKYRQRVGVRAGPARTRTHARMRAGGARRTETVSKYGPCAEPLPADSVLGSAESRD